MRLREEIKMCECINKLNQENYIHRDYFHENTYFIYPIKWDNGRGKVQKTGCLLNYCPICGEKLKILDEIKRGN